MASPPMSSWQDVRIWGIQDRRADARANKPWVVRWAVDGNSRGRTFRTKSEAEAFRSELFLAKRLTERFDPATAEPISWSATLEDMPIHRWTRRWLLEQWDEWQPRTRHSAIEALSRFLPLVVVSRGGDPPAELRTYCLLTLAPSEVIEPDHPVERWMEANMPALGELDRASLASVDARLGIGLHGQPLAASTAGRYRKVSRACVRRAADIGLLDRDPWPPPPRGRSHRKARRPAAIDTRRLPGPATMQRALSNIRTHQPGSHTYEVMTSVVYYAGLRPSEVVMLRPRHLTLPESGWGRIDVVEADISFDEPGEPKTGAREVPIPPHLVSLLREWIDEGQFGSADLLFRTRNGRRPTASNWSRSWHRALRATGQPTIRVYDCRHAAATTWLNAGVPLNEVARRLGHSVETLVSTYVGAIEADESVGNARIESALSQPSGVTF